MVVVGQALTTPESGWKRIDNTDVNITYNGSWSTITNASFHNGNMRESNIIGNSLKFNFKGSKLRLIGLLYLNRDSDIKVIIDGKIYNASQYASTEVVQGLFFEKTGLTFGEHSVEILKGNNGSVMTIDALDIDSDGSLSPFNKISLFDKILLLSNNDETISIGIKKYKNIVPKLTSNNSMGVVVNQSSIINNSTTTFQGYRIFDGLKGASDRWQPNGVTGWVSINLNSKQLIQAYEISNTDVDNYSRMANSWILYGSDNGSNWIIIDIQDNQTSWKSEESRVYILSSPVEYQHYRIQITANNGATISTIAELRLLQGEEFLLKTIPNHSEQNLIKYGVNSPIKADEIFSSKNYILQDTVSENAEGLWTTQLNRKPLSIKFN